MSSNSTEYIPKTTDHAANTPFVRWSDLNNDDRRDYSRMKQLFGQDPDTLVNQQRMCEQWSQQLLQVSPMYQFLLDHLKRRGCNFSPRHVTCQPCSQPREGAFAPKEGIILCSNHLKSLKHAEYVLSHELIMAYDHCSAVVDWNNPEHLACSAIRAANLSTECSFFKELGRLKFGFGKHHQECVKRRAILQVKASPVGREGTVAEDAVNAVWYDCIKDTAPFDEVP